MLLFFNVPTYTKTPSTIIIICFAERIYLELMRIDLRYSFPDLSQRPLSFPLGPSL